MADTPKSPFSSLDKALLRSTKTEPPPEWTRNSQEPRKPVSQQTRKLASQEARNFHEYSMSARRRTARRRFCSLTKKQSHSKT